MGKSPVREFVKVRKPYKITKQREKWTDDEHNRFLEALKLHGRAWQHIQDHIGTKSAVQIRSHAQKFFLKLEKGANGHPHNIEIPPPRPKRKPASSYPRKTGEVSRSPSEAAREKSLSKSISSDKPLMVANIRTYQEPVKAAMDQNMDQELGDGTSSTSIYFHHNSISERSEHFPVTEELRETRTGISKELQKNDAYLQFLGANEDFTDSRFGFAAEEMNQSKDHLHGGQSHKKKSEGIKSSGRGFFALPPASQLETNADLNLSLDSTRPTHKPKNFSMSSHQAAPSISLHNQFDNDDNSFSPLLSLTNHFPSLLASALSQNPAVHQAATIAAALLPPTYPDFSIPPNTNFIGEVLEMQSRAYSGVSAIVTATLAAASAWWRVHGLLPSPFLPIQTFLPQVKVQHAMETTQIQEDKNHSRENISKINKETFQRAHHPEQHEIDRTAQPCSALLEPSSSPSTLESTKKKHDPSSCDSNTSPCCEVEKDAALNKESSKEVNRHVSSFFQEIKHALRSSNNSCGEDLKQDSVAFAALFSREMLPQSFSPLHLGGNLTVNSGNEQALALQIDLNKKASTPTSCHTSKEQQAWGSSCHGPAVPALKRQLTETERIHADHEESSIKRSCP